MRKIVILREAGGLGDVVMTEPAVRGLRAAHPDAEIWYAGLGGYRAIVERFAEPPDVFLAVERHRRRDRDAPPDAERWPYLKHAADADRVVDLFCPAFRHERAERERTRKSRVECFAEASGVAPSAPRIRPAARDRDWARGFLAARGWWGREHGRLVALAPWSCGARRTWPKEHWRALARGLRRAGRTPLVFHPFDGPVRDVAGIRATGLPLDKAAALLSMCHAAVTNDSGLLHLAAGVGVPTLSLWGSTNPHVTLAPYPEARFLYKPDAKERPARCRAPCYSMRGACDYRACRRACRLLAAIGPDEALAAALAM